MKKYIKSLTAFFVLLISVVLIALAIKGNLDEQQLAYQTTKNSEVGGPFESTNSNSRFALVESIVEYGSFYLTDELAKFSAPDIVYHNGQYFSIFTPGVSFAAIPFYIVGKMYGIPQLGAYSLNLFLLILNMYLVAYLARKIGAGFAASLLSGFLFVFATNSIAYALTLTQHQLSVTIILLAVINLKGQRTVPNNIVLGLLYGAGLLVDIPNGIMLLPAILYALKKHLTVIHQNSIKVTINFIFLAMLLGLIPFLGVYGWYNKSLTGDSFAIAQFVGRSDYPATADNPEILKPEIDPYADKLPYSSRGFLNGYYTLFLSNERSWFYYSPVVLFGLFGLVQAYRNPNQRNQSTIVLMISIAAINGLSYSMFGDPWGGWSFGPRYLIPAAALLSVGIGTGIQKINKNPIAAFIFFILVLFSITITAFGTMSTNAIPPRVEAEALPEPIPYTYQYNIDRLKQNKSSSLIYNMYFAKSLTALQYTYVYILSITFVFITIFAFTFTEKSKVLIHE